MNIPDILKPVITSIIKALVDKPDETMVHDILMTPKTITVYLKTNSSDFGKIVGKYGKTIRSINYLASIIKQKHSPSDRRMINIEIIEENKGM
jgi:predicted RNA-binding protein YlqC (UPF0109 family)